MAPLIVSDHSVIVYCWTQSLDLVKHASTKDRRKEPA